MAKTLKWYQQQLGTVGMPVQASVDVDIEIGTKFSTVLTTQFTLRDEDLRALAKKRKRSTWDETDVLAAIKEATGSSDLVLDAPKTDAPKTDAPTP